MVRPVPNSAREVIRPAVNEGGEVPPPPTPAANARPAMATQSHRDLLGSAVDSIFSAVRALAPGDEPSPPSEAQIRAALASSLPYLRAEQHETLYGIARALRLEGNAHQLSIFIGQVSHETGGGRLLVEDNSGADYEDEGGLGNKHDGDGSAFRGRGYVQLTGRANYEAFENWYNELSHDQLQNYANLLSIGLPSPPIDVTHWPNNKDLSTEALAAMSTVYYWQNERLIKETGEVTTLRRTLPPSLNDRSYEAALKKNTRVLQGGSVGLDDRRRRSTEALEVLRTPVRPPRPEPRPTSDGKTHSVGNDDTAFSIKQQYGLTWEEFDELNPGTVWRENGEWKSRILSLGEPIAVER